MKINKYLYIYNIVMVLHVFLPQCFMRIPHFFHNWTGITPHWTHVVCWSSLANHLHIPAPHKEPQVQSHHELLDVFSVVETTNPSHRYNFGSPSSRLLRKSPKSKQIFFTNTIMRNIFNAIPQKLSDLSSSSLFL